VRWRVAAVVGLLTFAAALVGLLALQIETQGGDVRVLVAAQTIAPGQVIQANTAFLAPGGSLVRLGRAGLADAIPEASYREVAGAVALVRIPAGALILRHDLAMGAAADLRQLTLTLASMPSGLGPGSRVDLLAVWGQGGGAGSPGSICPAAAPAGCVVPLAQGVSLLAANPGAHTVTFDVPPSKVTPWLLLDATQPIWAVPAGSAVCPGVEQPISSPSQALQQIRGGLNLAACPAAESAGGAS
jgi:hypothetical protein